MNPQPFPWHLIDRATREEARAVSDARRFLTHAGSTERAVLRLAEIANAPFSFRVRRCRVAAVEPRAGFLAVVFSIGDAPSTRMAVLVEDALAANFTARAMKRAAPRAFDSSSVAPAALAGAVAAFLSAAARAAGAGPVTVSWCGPASDLAQAHLDSKWIDLSGLVFVGDDAYEAYILVPDVEARRSPKPLFSSEILVSLSAVPITLPIVGAAVSFPRSDVDALAPGDVALLGRRPGVRSMLAGDVAIVAHESDRGVRARLGEDGSLVILEGAEEVAMTAEQEAIAENAGHAPVIVRVEIGQVTMMAREWAALKAGDVVATGQRIAEPIVLRVGGVEVARGELVELEGEVGVRIVSRS